VAVYAHRSTNDPESVQLNYWPEPNEKYENAALKESGTG